MQLSNAVAIPSVHFNKEKGKIIICLKKRSVKTQRLYIVLFRIWRCEEG